MLITSRNPDWRGVATPLGVAEFTRAESVHLLRSQVPGLSDREADRVAEAVGDLPLAVDQAAALLADTGLDTDTYLRLLAERTEQVLAHGGGSGGYPVSLAASWTVAFDRLAADDPVAFELMTVAAWLGPEPVPLTLYTTHPDRLPAALDAAARDPLVFTGRTAVLRRRGMARVTADSIQLHRLTAALLRVRTVDGGRWAAVAVGLLRHAAPEDPWNNPGCWPTWRQLLAHVLAVTDPARDLDPVTGEAAWLLDRAGSYLRTRGSFERRGHCTNAPTTFAAACSVPTTPTPWFLPPTSPSPCAGRGL